MSRLEEIEKRKQRHVDRFDDYPCGDVGWLIARLKEAKAALAFYGDIDKYMPGDIEKDAGSIARDFLANMEASDGKA